MRRKKAIHGNGADALTPMSLASAPTPNTRIEKILFEMYMFEKDRADAMARLYHDAERKLRAEQTRFTIYRARGIARGIAKRLTPTHLADNERMEK